MAFGEEDTAPAYGSEPDMGASADPLAGPELDEEEAALAEAFPELAESPERLSALKTAIRMCVERAQSGEYESDKPAPKKGGAKVSPSLVLAFGSDKKSK